MESHDVQYSDDESLSGSVRSSPRETFPLSFATVVVAPLKMDGYHLDQFLEDFDSKRLGTTDLEINFINCMLKVFRVIEDTKSFGIFKKKKDDMIVFEYIKERDLFNMLKKYTIWIKELDKEKKQVYVCKPFFYLYSKYQIKFKANELKFLPFNERNPVADKSIVNIFNGWKSRLTNLEQNKISLILSHIKNVFCSGVEEHYQYLIKWLADIVQRPQIKAGVAVVLQSDQGAGKNIFFNWFNKYILGRRHSITISHLEKITGRFNSSLEGKMLVVVNEVCSKDKKHDQFEIMKTLITDEEQQVERKGLESMTIDSYSRFVFCSNSEKPIHIESGNSEDRRYFVLKFKKPNDSFNYFKTLAQNMNQDTADHFYTYLMDLDLNNFNITQFPITEAREEIQELSVCKDILYIRDHYWTDWLPHKNVYQHYREWCNEKGYSNPSNETWFSKNISAFIERKHQRLRYMKRKDLGEDRSELIEIPNSDGKRDFN